MGYSTAVLASQLGLIKMVVLPKFPKFSGSVVLPRFLQYYWEANIQKLLYWMGK